MKRKIYQSKPIQILVFKYIPKIIDVWVFLICVKYYQKDQEKSNMSNIFLKATYTVCEVVHHLILLEDRNKH